MLEDQILFSFDTLPFAVLAALVGVILGSFIALVSVRLPQGRGVMFGRSACEGCGTTLAPWSLIPVISYLFQGGKCAGCGSDIRIRYPLTEMAAGVIGAWAVLSQADGGQADLVPVILTAGLGWQLLLISIVDGEHYWLPDSLTFPLLATGVIASLPPGGATPLESLVGAAVGFGALWLVAFAYRRLRGRDGLGGGDPFLMAAGGAWVGWLGLPTVLLWASVVGFSMVGARLIVRRRIALTDRLPFGPCLAIGIWLTWLLGPLAG